MKVSTATGITSSDDDVRDVTVIPLTKMVPGFRIVPYGAIGTAVGLPIHKRVPVVATV